MESLSGKLFVMIVQHRQYWLTDYLSLFLRGIPVWKITQFSCCLFQDGWGGVWENIICFMILRLPDAPKNIRVFWKLFPQHLKKERKAHQDDGHEARRTIRF